MRLVGYVLQKVDREARVRMGEVIPVVLVPSGGGVVGVPKDKCRYVHWSKT